MQFMSDPVDIPPWQAERTEATFRDRRRPDDGSTQSRFGDSREGCDALALEQDRILRRRLDLMNKLQQIERELAECRAAALRLGTDPIARAERREDPVMIPASLRQAKQGPEGGQPCSGQLRPARPPGTAR